MKGGQGVSKELSGDPMTPSGDSDDTAELLREAKAGSPAARQKLLERYRERLHRMVSFRMDPRLRQRVNPSDVVQETLIHAWNDLDAYLRDEAMSPYLWLRHLAWSRLIELYRLHVVAKKRSVNREGRGMQPLSEAAGGLLAERLATSATSPSAKLMKEELQLRVKVALGELPDAYREVLILRYLEELSIKETATLLETEEATIKKRHLRALEKLREHLGDQSRTFP
jgi:RNA polymerase sigma-70 factor (ECF subfamily)